jgi:hypothetical protein
MKLVLTDKKTVAWFTLAECVSRGERERAFGVYRLLSHSLDDRALAAQLEGDLFAAFKMPYEAIEKYACALRLYKQAGKFLEAAAVGEHMQLLQPEESSHMQQLLELYSALQFEERVSELIVVLVKRYVAQGLYDLTCGLATTVEELHGYGKQGYCYEQVVAILSHIEGVPLHVRVFYVQKATYAYMYHGVDLQLKQFLAQLSVHDTEAYASALKIIKE